nr:MAG TPA: hypothetical protein [Caudoviricetes sp.]
MIYNGFKIWFFPKGTQNFPKGTQFFLKVRKIRESQLFRLES